MGCEKNNILCFFFDDECWKEFEQEVDMNVGRYLI